MKVFISYRRKDSAGYAGRLYDRLERHYGDDNIFMDIDTLRPGQDFLNGIQQAIDQVDVMLVIIGRQWLDMVDENGNRRLDNENDFVRLEIAEGLKREIYVIPTLVSEAEMPKKDNLPEELIPLARRQALELSNARFHDDVNLLISTIDDAIEESAVRRRQKQQSEQAAKAEAKTNKASVLYKDSLEIDEPFPLKLIHIPAGEFLMGSDRNFDKHANGDERPQHYVFVPDYYIGQYPITNQQYAYFVEAAEIQAPENWKDGQMPEGMEDHPLVNVDWFEALAFCEWLSGKIDLEVKLPSEAEWEKAARGTQGYIYPWGNEFNEKVCNTHEGRKAGTTPVGLYSPDGDSPYGVADMIGNVWEWTRSIFKKYPYDPDDGRENLEDETLRILRGGSFFNPSRFSRCACRYRGGYYPTLRYYFSGFRIVVTHK